MRSYHMIYQSSSPVFTTGDLSTHEALGYKKYVISDYVSHRRNFHDSFIIELNKFNSIIKI